ncbi:type II toxin-antitoxin system VapC family toxin [Nocardiopsis exhalans]|uniref:Ribonuclease VapC n=1 Tax=Nocardiopsis exhalans TaxID=163604 RepID=A0ABY5DAH3_9ACTN|nr:type II toxin-antitoxin system VapC family toxin [Nocardiopsis exhalans]USY20000.1 type II toxin-antitoxin system VapC family toxin [Nocardiopsis exhalans]
MFIYLDTCAALKLFKEEVESEALERWLNEHAQARQITSYLTRTELRRALHAVGASPDTVERAGVWLSRVAHLRMPAEVFDTAGDIAPGTRLRSLDALHVSCALGLGAALSAFVTYDKRLAEAAESVSLPVVTPSP